MHLFIFLSALSFVGSTQAAEDAFTKAVMTSCGKTKEEAEQLGGGVTGPRGQFLRCASATVEVSADCKVQCVKSGNSMD